MRKLNQPGRPKAVPCSIPRPPTPPQSVQVQTLKSILLSNQQQMRHRNQSNNNINNNTANSSNPSTVAVTHSTTTTQQASSTPQLLNGQFNHSQSSYNHHHHQQHHFSQPQHQPFNSQAPSPNKSHLNNSHTLCPQSMNQHQASRNSLFLESSHITSTNTSGSSNTPNTGPPHTKSITDTTTVIDSPGDAIEPNCDFPAPPEEFLEDIRANRKQEEIEGPLEASPSVTPPDSIASSDIAIDLPLPQELQRNSHSFNGHGSLNSSITETETTESSSWSPSPTASPLASPSHSSWESASIQSFSYPASSSSSSHHHHHSSPSRFPFPPPQVQAALITNKPPQQGVTLAPLLPCNLDREPIYQRLPLVRPGSSLSTASTSSSVSSSHLPSTAGPTGSLARPPDYQTAMKRLSLAKANSTLHRPNPASTISHSMKSVVSLHAQNITGPTSSSSPSLPLKAGPQFLVPSVPVATVNPHRAPPSPPPPCAFSRNLTTEATTKTAVPPPRQMVNGVGKMSLQRAGREVNSASSLVNGPSYNRATNSGPCDEIFSSSSESSSTHDSLLDQHSPLPPPKAVQSTGTTGSKSAATLAATTTSNITATTPTGNAIGGTSNSPLLNCPVSTSFTNPPPATGGGIMKKKVKKRVSFSDQVELVCSEEMIQEEHMPNPVLERVLGKAFLQNNHINNG